MKKDSIEYLFKNLEDSFDVEGTPNGHQHRFLDKLNQNQNTNTKEKQSRFPFKKLIAIAAVFAVIVSIGSLFLNTEVTAADLASVSPEMEQTQSFFTNTINNELEKLNKINSPDSKYLVQDALRQMDVLEKKYEQLKTDLVESGNDKRVIYAMIQNFQNRINLLEQVIEKIEEIKNLKTNSNENII